MSKNFKNRSKRTKSLNTKSNVRKEEPRKDSRSKRVNFDNERVDKLPPYIKDALESKGGNDLRWYMKNPALLKKAGSLPFATIAGITAVSSNEDNGLSCPGVMELTYTPNYVSNAAVVAQSFNGQYSDIVHANSRNTSYDATDLAILEYAAIEVFAAIGMGIRAYGLMQEFTEPNAYTPISIITAAGFNYNDLRANYYRMYDDLAFLIAQSRQLWIPNTIPLLERRFWMNTSVFTDGEAAQAQYIVMRQKRFLKYEGFTDKKGGKLVATAEEARDMKWASYTALVQSMFDALIPDQDRGIIYGDILKAYGKEGIFALNDLDLNYRTRAIYNPEVLWQIENCTTRNVDVVEILQTSKGILSQKYFADAPVLAADTWSALNISLQAVPDIGLINFHQKEAPAPEQVVVATRLTALGQLLQPQYEWSATNKAWEFASGKQAIVPRVSGTEIICQVILHCNRINNGAITRETIPIEYVAATTKSDIGSTNIVAKEFWAWSAFDWAPVRYAMYATGTITSTGTAPPQVVGVMCDYDMWAKISQSELETLHNACLYSLYNIPTL